MEPVNSLASVTHAIQTSLTPIFLLTGIGTLLGVFNTRLTRVADQYEHLSELLEAASDPDRAANYERHLLRLRQRRSALDTSVALGSLGGVVTCSVVCALFLGSLRSQAGSDLLLGLFGGALGCTIAALMAFLIDTTLAWHGLRQDGPMPARRSR